MFVIFALSLQSRAVVLGSGYFINKEDWQDLLKKIKSEVSPGFRLTQFDLDCRGSARMDVRVFYRIFNPTIVALFRKHFWYCPQKLAVADFIEIVNNGILVLQSRVINDEEFPLKSAYRFHQPEQETALDLFVTSVSGLQFYTKGSMTF